MYRLACPLIHELNRLRVIWNTAVSSRDGGLGEDEVICGRADHKRVRAGIDGSDDRGDLPADWRERVDALPASAGGWSVLRRMPTG